MTMAKIEQAPARAWAHLARWPPKAHAVWRPWWWSWSFEWSSFLFHLPELGLWGMCAIAAGEGKSALFCTEFSEEFGDAPNSVTNLALIFAQCWKNIFFTDYSITEFGDDLLATNSSLNPVMKIGLFSFVIFLVTEFSAYVCTEVDENDFGQDFSTEFSEKLCASLNSMTN